MQEKKLKSLFFTGALLLSSSIQAAVSVIVTAAPLPREVIVEPRGYSRCYTAPASFYNGVWHYQRRVCEYNSGGRYWVGGFWQCISFRVGGVCTRWNWIGPHWATSRDMVYIRVPGPRYEPYHRYAPYDQRNVRVHGSVDVNVHHDNDRNRHGRDGRFYPNEHEARRPYHH